MEINKEDCVYFQWIVIRRGCCGRHNRRVKKHGNCKALGDARKICNTDMPYCQYKKRDDGKDN